MHVFLPPTDRLEDYTTLVGAIERAASATGTPVVIEGYGPPPDARLTSLTVTPDPGVIEVNVQPTRSWAEQRDLTVTLYEEARQARLTTDQARRASLYKEAQRILVDDAPWVFVDHEIQIAALARRVQGFKLHPSFDLRVETISLK